MKRKIKSLLLFISFIALTLNLSVVLQQKQNNTETIAQTTQTLGINNQTTSVGTFLNEISLESIFSNNNRAPHKEDITIKVTGDVNLARSANAKVQQSSDVNYPFSKTNEIFNKADVTIMNLESPLGEQCPILHSGMKFCAQNSNANRLQKTGVDIISLANNHANDLGSVGLENTKQILFDLDIKAISHGESTLINRKNITVGVIAYDIVWHQLNLEELTDSIQNLRKKADITIAFFHWGNEYQSLPNEKQRKYAKRAVDAGADLVIGNHPHWVQAIELYKNKLIVYSHGNFVFDQLWSTETREGLVGEYIFRQNKLSNAAFIPIWIGDDFQPEQADAVKKGEVIQHMKEISQELLKD